MPNTTLATLRRRAGTTKPRAASRSTGGRPTLYKPEHCAIVEALGRQGKSRMEIASILNIDRKTISAWERDFEEFGQALARAMTHSQAWWERKAQQSLGKKHFQAQLWRYSMAGRFKEDYAEAKADVAAGFADWMSAVLEIANRRKPALETPGDGARPVEAQVVETKGK